MWTHYAALSADLYGSLHVSTVSTNNLHPKPSATFAALDVLRGFVDPCPRRPHLSKRYHTASALGIPPWCRTLGDEAAKALAILRQDPVKDVEERGQSKRPKDAAERSG